MLGKDGVLDDIYINSVILDKVEVDVDLIKELEKQPPYQLIMPIEYESCYHSFNMPYSLG